MTTPFSTRAAQVAFTAILLFAPAAALRGQSKPVDPTPAVSIVDYMKTVGLDSGKGNRRKLFEAKWPKEEFKGTAEQNTRLLRHLLAERGQTLLPLPSSKISSCEDFYKHSEIAKYLTTAMQGNVVGACVVTGDNKLSNTIREELQKTYAKTKPADGKVYTAAEHKQIHDAAYKAAGCKEDSAWVGGWWLVNTVSLPKPALKFAIEKFGACTAKED